MNKIIEEQIMYNKWHQFLYGYETEKRTEFLKNMEKHYPIVYGQDLPMAIYLEPYGIMATEERIEQNLDDRKKMLLKILAREYLKTTMVYQILSKIENNSEIMGKVEEKLLKFLWTNCKSQLSTVKEHLFSLEKTAKDIEINYNEIISSQKGVETYLNNDINLFVSEWFWTDLKEILKNKEQFNIIINHNQNITIESYKAIMSIVNSRCAGSTCMKIAIEADKWPIWTDLNGVFAENPHDYSIYELDDNYKKTLNRKKEKWEI